MSSSTRRTFLKHAAASAALLGAGDLAFLGRFPPVSAADAKLDPKLVRLDSGIEPLVVLVEETPRDKLLEEIAARIKKGTSYREVVTALFLAGVRNVRPHGGDLFHSVLVIHSAHQASLAAPDTERWLPIFYALDEFKRAQNADKGWRMAPTDDAKLPPDHKARQAFLDAVEKWDPEAAESAAASLARNAGGGEVFDMLAMAGSGNYVYLGHNAIFVSNGWRTLQTIGWQHAEPVLRSLARVVFELKPDAVWKANRELAAKLPEGWQDGKLTPAATTDLLAMMRTGSASEVSQKAAELLKGGVSPQSIWDAAFAAVGELQMRQPARPSRWAAGIFSLHAATSLNALRYAYSNSSQDETRRFLTLQSVAIVPLFLATMGKRGGKIDDGKIDQMEAAPLKTPAEATAEIFADVGTDRGLAARKTLSFLKDNPRPQDLIDAARRIVFLKGVDTHDYKYSVAVFEDYQNISPAWRDRYLANCMYQMRSSADKDNALVGRIKAALQG